jgi:sulfonate transport system ATP-binding protein
MNAPFVQATLASETVTVPSDTQLSTPSVTVAGLTRQFGSRVVLNGLSLQIARGEFVALLGESGCGKTTLLRALARLDAIDGGRIDAPRRPAVVFQEHRLLPWANLWQNVALGLYERDAEHRAIAALSEVGLAGRQEDWPRNLSGGQAQRVALARALVQEPELLLLDEPFAALDALTRIRMHLLVRDLVALHRPGVLLVTHDVDEAIALADRILVMRDGTIAWEFRARGDRREPLDPTDLRTRLLAELGVHVTT